MRNGHKLLLARMIVALTTAGMAAGCGATEKPGQRPLGGGGPAQSPTVLLDRSYRALENQQYDDAVARADQVLAAVGPHGAGAAEALYVRGRALEGKNAAGVSDEQARANLQAAREAYIQALGENPPQPLHAYLRASLGNVAYFQDDYQTAIAQLSAAYDHLDREDLKAWALYRIGLSQQRQAQFAQADQTFAAVQQRHGNTIPAQRARERQGARAFFVQLATFAQPAAADRAAAELRKQGIAATRVAGPEGRAFLRVGPMASYAHAQSTRRQLLERYPDAVIIP